MENGYVYRLETPSDWRAAEALTREAFWNVYRRGCDEHYIVHRLRKSPYVVETLNYVCTDGDRLCGHIFYTRTQVAADDGQVFPVLSFGPLSVAPAHQRRGIGSHLVRMTLEKAAGLGFPGVLITGNPDYYHRFGFRPASDFHIAAEDGSSFPALMACELGEGRLNGVRGRLHFCREFTEIDPEEVLRFDAQFPPRERLKLPGQIF